MQELMEELAASQTRTEKIYQKPVGWIIEYPVFADMADKQMHAFWPFDEIQVSNDIQDIRVKATETEREGITENLKLFTQYEVDVGDEYWSGRIMKTFKRPEIQRMASMNSAVEFNSHAPFYNKINEVLFLDNEEFYSSWKNDPNLVERMKFIGDAADAKDDLVSIGSFAFIEGAVLYSTFAYLKHFQSQECNKNLIKQINGGINLSVGDENLHTIAGATLFKTIKKERKLDKRQKNILKDIILSVAETTYKHEELIIDKTFGDRYIKGLTAKNQKDFVKHRVNLVLNMLGYRNIFDEKKLDGFVASWFYNSINSFQMHDFFAVGGSEYHIDWKEERFGECWEEEQI